MSKLNVPMAFMNRIPHNRHSNHLDNFYTPGSLTNPPQRISRSADQQSYKAPSTNITRNKASTNPGGQKRECSTEVIHSNSYTLESEMLTDLTRVQRA